MTRAEKFEQTFGFPIRKHVAANFCAVTYCGDCPIGEKTDGCSMTLFEKYWNEEYTGPDKKDNNTEEN